MNAFLKAHPEAVVHSTPVTVGGSPIAVVGLEASKQARFIAVVSLTGPTAVAVANLPLPVPWFEILSMPVEVADVTGDGRPDFLIHLEAADNNPGVLVSDEGGEWRVVPISPSDANDVYIGRTPKITNNQLQSYAINCVPDCASGKSYTEVWTYERPGGYLKGSFLTSGR